MEEEKAKHLNPKSIENQFLCFERQLANLTGSFNRLRNNVNLALSESAFGKMSSLADEAFEIIKQKGRFTSFDCASLKIFDTTQRKRLFTELGKRHPEVKMRTTRRYGDKRKIYIAWLDDKKFEETQQDPDQRIKDFVKKHKPTRAQLISNFLWGAKGDEKVARLVRDNKMIVDNGRVVWIGD